MIITHKLTKKIARNDPKRDLATWASGKKQNKLKRNV